MYNVNIRKERLLWNSVVGCGFGNLGNMERGKKESSCQRLFPGSLQPNHQPSHVSSNIQHSFFSSYPSHSPCFFLFFFTILWTPSFPFPSPCFYVEETNELTFMWNVNTKMQTTKYKLWLSLQLELSSHPIFESSQVSPTYDGTDRVLRNMWTRIQLNNDYIRLLPLF